MLSAPSLADVNLCDLYSLTCQQLYHLAWVDVFVQNGRMACFQCNVKVFLRQI